PLAAVAFLPRKLVVARTAATFLTGFCFIANGAYIAGGVMHGIGDADEMLRSGSPHWVLIAFGAITIPVGLLIWHRLGSLRGFIADPSMVGPGIAYAVLGLLGVLGCLATALSSG
ncbi:hypothetical protein OAS39_08430, partial [Pirellulales bacterium]|nr:hypothetical protein [Pirellulales bacterium]